jgi:poly(3-hydroxybutyrate) depolymerase
MAVAAESALTDEGVLWHRARPTEVLAAAGKKEPLTRRQGGEKQDHRGRAG